jgi:hypothetical protein
MNLEQAIAETNSPKDFAEVLRQFHDNNHGQPADFVAAMVAMICSGEVVLYLDQDCKLTVKAPYLTN